MGEERRGGEPSRGGEKEGLGFAGGGCFDGAARRFWALTQY